MPLTDEERALLERAQENGRRRAALPPDEGGELAEDAPARPLRIGAAQLLLKYGGVIEPPEPPPKVRLRVAVDNDDTRRGRS